jgi:DTW domain-containing protein YfiP
MNNPLVVGSTPTRPTKVSKACESCPAPREMVLWSLRPNLKSATDMCAVTHL